MCCWAALSLSNIAAVFLPDILLSCDSSDPVKHELVAISTTVSRERAASWFKDNKIPNPEGIKLCHPWEMLERGDFDVVYISTPHPLHYQHVVRALDCRRNVLVEEAGHDEPCPIREADPDGQAAPGGADGRDVDTFSPGSQISERRALAQDW